VVICSVLYLVLDPRFKYCGQEAWSHYLGIIYQVQLSIFTFQVFILVAVSLANMCTPVLSFAGRTWSLVIHGHWFF